MTTEEVYIPEVLEKAVLAMKVPIYPATIPVTFFSINYIPGTQTQIIDALENMDGTTLDGLKYPLIAVEMPISEKNGSGFLEVTFPRIIIAYLTKTSTGDEPVMDKYSSDGVFKNILRPCKNELIRRIAWSTYTNMGDPDMYEFISRDLPCRQTLGKGLNDFVDIIEILNLKAIIFPQIKTCN